MTRTHSAILSRLLLCTLRTLSPFSSPFHSVLTCGVCHRKHLPWRCGWIPPYPNCWKRRDYFQDRWRNQHFFSALPSILISGMFALDHFAGWNIASVFLMLIVSQKRSVAADRESASLWRWSSEWIKRAQSSAYRRSQTSDFATFIFAFRRWALKIIPSVLYVIWMPVSETLKAKRSYMLERKLKSVGPERILAWLR